MVNVPLRKIVIEKVKKAGFSVDNFGERKLGEIENDLYAGRIDVEKAMDGVQQVLRGSKCYLEDWDYSDIKKAINYYLK